MSDVFVQTPSVFFFLHVLDNAILVFCVTSHYGTLLILVLLMVLLVISSVLMVIFISLFIVIFQYIRALVVIVI